MALGMTQDQQAKMPPATYKCCECQEYEFNAYPPDQIFWSQGGGQSRYGPYTSGFYCGECIRLLRLPKGPSIKEFLE